MLAPPGNRPRPANRVSLVGNLQARHVAELDRLIERHQLAGAAPVKLRVEGVEHRPRPELLAHHQAAERVLLDPIGEPPIRAERRGSFHGHALGRVQRPLRHRLLTHVQVVALAVEDFLHLGRASLRVGYPQSLGELLAQPLPLLVEERPLELSLLTDHLADFLRRPLRVVARDEIAEPGDLSGPALAPEDGEGGDDLRRRRCDCCRRERSGCRHRQHTASHGRPRASTDTCGQPARKRGVTDRAERRARRWRLLLWLRLLWVRLASRSGHVFLVCHALFPVAVQLRRADRA